MITGQKARRFMDAEFKTIVKLVNSSPIWENIKTELELQIETICDTKGTDIGRMRQQGKGEPDMAFLVKKIVDCSSTIIVLYGLNEKFLYPKFLKAYQKCVKNKEADFKFLLERMRIGTKKIENGMDRLLARRKKIGRQTVHGKNLLTIVLVKLFLEVGYRKEKCFSIVSKVLNLIGSQDHFCNTGLESGGGFVHGFKTIRPQNHPGHPNICQDS